MLASLALTGLARLANRDLNSPHDAAAYRIGAAAAYWRRGFRLLRRMRFTGGPTQAPMRGL
jgi:hypothetical protein